MSNTVMADKSRNRLYIRYGEMTIEQYFQFTGEIIKEAGKLEQGFTILSDLRNFSLPKGENPIQANIREITEVQQKLKKLGASEIIRVVDPQVWLFMAMGEAEKSAGYEAFIFDDYEEADAALDDMTEDIHSENGRTVTS
ncbi:hypothetical protein [Desulfobotulus mexicanus]|uniref:STAS domain-containing protein n=1 Tax=Desulfobotulus mexicanus TaxID=2586642 RepID=A0A5S5MEI7_9BACT|nr:hypothetical protein [Desulfobotulus mexicanus]TYT74089.1 hypothetical protein FIM25_11805 [Desulfobotulus mexicanus]